MATESNKPEKRKLLGHIKGLGSELKKVTWPTFSKVVSQTGIVIAVTLFFLLVLMGMDAGLSALYGLLTSGLGAEESVLLGNSGVLSLAKNAVAAMPQLPFTII